LPPRAIWKGFLKVAEVTCPVGLYAAASASDRVALHTVNRVTGHRVRREFVDSETGEAVPRDDQVKGYEVAKDEYVSLDPEEIAAVIPHGDKTLSIGAFISHGEVDELYFDKPYYLAPADPSGLETFELLRDGMRTANVAAIAEAVLFRRVRNLIVRPYDRGLAASTLNFDYEVRSAKEVFSGTPAKSITGEMLDLAMHIIQTKTGTFDPRAFKDRYEDALVKLVKDKLEGKTIAKPAPVKREASVTLLDALRESAKAMAGPSPKAAGKAARGKSAAKHAPRGAARRKAS
jgi:DNA end-binding protein Ku